ncbi:GNAT family N-acetyltransferase [Clostridium sp.]|uniref:GNAT family N-acetyltransferase n=1 Tax=Clostridium sp. TaxID=1506 RepID=UPI003F4075FB
MYNGKLVKLRAYKEEDIALAVKFVNDEETKKLLDSGAIFPMTIWQEEEWVKGRKGTSDLTYDFAMEDLKTGKYIGGCSINESNIKNRHCTIGIMIGDKDYWGKGYGTDALKTLIKFIFEELNFDKVKLGAFSFNKRAIACYKKVGFIEEGVLRKEIYRNGKYYDNILMGMLKEEYFENLK